MKAAPRHEIVLASASPRRRDLLGALGLALLVDPTDVDEARAAGAREPAAAARAVALAKAGAAASRRSGDVIIAADTVVVAGERAVGKPAGEVAARALLVELRGRAHDVVTAVVVRGPAGESVDVVRTTVRMRSYTDDEIADYVASGAPYDKAGAYGIQDEPFRPVESVAGCWCNVMGLPLWTAVRLLAGAGRLSPRRPEQVFPRCVACPLRDPG